MSFEATGYFADPFIKASCSLRRPGSMRKGPKGTMAAAKILVDQLMGRCNTRAARASAMTYNMNSTPCAIPTMLTASGLSARYFRGMAMKKRTRLEMPSMIPVCRSHLIALMDSIALKLNVLPQVFKYSVSYVCPKGRWSTLWQTRSCERGGCLRKKMDLASLLCWGGKRSYLVLMKFAIQSIQSRLYVRASSERN